MKPFDAPTALDVMWQRLRELVAFDTATPEPTRPLAERIAERLDRPGWAVSLADLAVPQHPAVIAAAGPEGPGGLVLSGHLDVVPWRGQPGWTHDPLRLQRAGDRAIGRGVADMKGFLAQCLAIAESIDPAQLRAPLVLLLTSEEEVGCLGAARLAPRLEHLLAPRPVPGACLIGEPTGGEVFRAHKGHVTMTVTTHGRGGHSSRPDLGANAITAMAGVIAAVDTLGRELAATTSAEARALFPDFPAVPFNPGTISGGTADNMIAERCTMVLGFRPGPGFTAEDLIDRVTARAHDAAAAVKGASLSVDGVVVAPAMTSPDDGPLADVLRSVSGRTTLRGAPYATDGGQFETAGIASYIWGPGELEQAHQPDESVPVTALEDGVRALHEIVCGMCG